VDQIISSSFAGKWFDVADKDALFESLRMALSGGFVRPGETLLCCVRKELRPELEKLLERAKGYSFAWGDAATDGSWHELRAHRFVSPVRKKKSR
jgi:ADP-ribose pyrophosphatase YjhB (NUDIX family)